MITSYFPSIRAQDYDAFQLITDNNLPSSFDQWTNEQFEKITKEGAHRTVVEVEVYPDEFTEFCRAHLIRCTALGLEHFAYHKGIGKRD